MPSAGLFGSIGKVKFGGIDYLGSDYDFGLFATTEIKPFKVGKLLAETQDYFRVEVV